MCHRYPDTNIYTLLKFDILTNTNTNTLNHTYTNVDTRYRYEIPMSEFYWQNNIRWVGHTSTSLDFEAIEINLVYFKLQPDDMWVVTRFLWQLKLFFHVEYDFPLDLEHDQPVVVTSLLSVDDDLHLLNLELHV